MNNLDMSSSGHNIELSVRYDSDASQWRFDEWLEGMDGVPVTALKFGRNDALYLIGDAEVGMFSLPQLKRMKKAKLCELHEQYELDYCADSKDFTRVELIDDLEGVTIKRHYEFLLASFSWRELGACFPHEYYLSNGCSQGDARYIVAIDGFRDGEKRDIDHVLWDTPICVSLTVDDKDYYDLLDDEYEYGRAAVAEAVGKLEIPQECKDWIIENLPMEPDHA